MRRGRTGRDIEGSSVGSEPFKAFVPYDLPPCPALDLKILYPLLEKANLSLGRLDGMSRVVPDLSIFLYMYVRKEAVLSSQIEGTQSSLSDLLIYESDKEPGVPIDDVEEVSCYVAATNYALEALKKLPVSLRLLRQVHKILLSHTRGSTKMPGEFRRSQNWIGGSKISNAHFVPPPPEELMNCLDPFEKFLHEGDNLPVLLKAALAHVQFETIHLF